MAGPSLTEEALRAAAVLRDPARPSSTPYTDAVNYAPEIGLPSPLDMRAPFVGAKRRTRENENLQTDVPPRGDTPHDYAEGGYVVGPPPDRMGFEAPPDVRAPRDELAAGIDADVNGAIDPSETWESFGSRMLDDVVGAAATAGAGVYAALPSTRGALLGPLGVAWDFAGDRPGPVQGPPLPPEAGVETEGPLEESAKPEAARDAAVPRDSVIGTRAASGGSGVSEAAGGKAPQAPVAQEWDPAAVAETAKNAARDDALLRAGLAMMASNNPSFMGVLGEGGLAGLDGYQQDQQRYRTEARADYEMQSKAAQQQFDNEIKQISAELMLAKDARAQKAAAARLARSAVSAGILGLTDGRGKAFDRLMAYQVNRGVDPESAMQWAATVVERLYARGGDELAGLTDGTERPPIADAVGGMFSSGEEE